MIVAHIDGSCTPPNPGGVMGIGVLVENGINVETYSETYPRRKNNTNNVAEYLAFKKLLEVCENCEGETIVVYSDSEMLVNQMNEYTKISRGAYKEVAITCYWLLNTLKKKNTVQIYWIPRAMNETADYLSKCG